MELIGCGMITSRKRSIVSKLKNSYLPKIQPLNLNNLPKERNQDTINCETVRSNATTSTQNSTSSRKQNIYTSAQFFKGPVTRRQNSLQISAKCKKQLESLFPTETSKNFKLNFSLKLKSIQNINDYYEIGNIIGQGSYGKVHIVIQKATKNVMALKILSKDKLQSTEKEIEILQEMSLLKKLDHPNIIKVYEILQDSENYYIVTELLYGGTLKNKMESLNFNEKEAAPIMKQIFSAINYLHENQIMHRDLKPQNILFQDERSGIVKLIDFGYAHTLKKGETDNKRMGTPYYMAPEVVDKKNYNEKIDVWSLGIILYYTLTGIRPYSGEETEDIFKSINEGQLSKEFLDLVYKMLDRNPKTRMQIKDCFLSEWIQNNCQIPQCSKNCLINIKEHLDELKKNNVNNINFKHVFKHFVKKLITCQVIDHSEFPKIQKSFQALDQDGIGFVQKDYLLQAYLMLNEYSNQEAQDIVDQLFNYIGCDNLSYTDFFFCSLKVKHILTENHINNCFNLLANKQSDSIIFNHFIRNQVDFKQNSETDQKQFLCFLQNSIFKQNQIEKQEFLNLFSEECELSQSAQSEEKLDL